MKIVASSRKEKGFALNPLVLCLIATNIIFDTSSRIAMNLDGVFKFYNALNLCIKHTYSLNAYLFHTPFHYTSRNFAEFVKGSPIWVASILHIRDFHVLTYVWSFGLSALNWAAILSTIYLIEKKFEKRISFLMFLTFAIYSITLTSYLDSTLNFAALIGVALVVLTRESQSSKREILLFVLCSVIAISVHEILIPIIGILLIEMIIRIIFQIWKSNAEFNFSLRFFKIGILGFCFSILVVHYFSNYNSYTTTNAALNPHFIHLSTLTKYPRSFLLYAGFLVLYLSLSKKLIGYLDTKKRQRRIQILALIVPLLVYLDFQAQARQPRSPFLDFQYRSDFSILILVSIVILILGQTMKIRYLKLYQPKLINYNFSLFLGAIAIASSVAHIQEDLSWNKCWSTNISLLNPGQVLAGSKMVGTCNTAPWTTLMTSIVYSNSKMPNTFIDNASDFRKAVEDPSFVQKSSHRLIFPFGLDFPISSPGLDLSRLPNSN